MEITIPWQVIIACIGVGLSMWLANPFAGMQFSIALFLSASDIKTATGKANDDD